ncbi:Zinc finger protein Gfi-1 [Araneus ventricosus]|uniref:Zinc finger protein Gfi-1 n=1 Tax=Araneus ventricosus TaxID=182803 RepID=A0A4Y2DVR5_ARAVE|nr:Zinc finger protein Gfi-1 [Araneus ventricosus]
MRTASCTKPNVDPSLSGYLNENINQTNAAIPRNTGESSSQPAADVVFPESVPRQLFVCSFCALVQYGKSVQKHFLNKSDTLCVEGAPDVEFVSCEFERCIESVSDKIHKCSVCLKEFPFLSKACKENRNRRRLNKEFSGFHPLSGVNLHMLFVQPGKSFTCQFCTKSFRQKRDLDRHIFTHTGEKPYTCVVCGKDFARKDKLIAHSRTHSEGRMYTCDICGKTIDSEKSWKEHLEVHS